MHRILDSSVTFQISGSHNERHGRSMSYEQAAAERLLTITAMPTRPRDTPSAAPTPPAASSSRCVRYYPRDTPFSRARHE